MKRGAFLFVLAALLPGCGGSAPAAATVEIRDGHARFQVLTPTLVRLEYAEDDRFEDGPTQTVPSRALTTAFSSTVEGGQRVIRTEALTLRYTLGSGAFTPSNVSVQFARGGAAIHPDFATVAPDNLGGWRRSLDNQQDPQPLNDGLLTRAGWYLLDDSATVVMTAVPPGFAPRAHAGAYQDGYFFGYGQDYARGLADLRTLTGPAPLLPRKAFGVWFSRYWAYTETELHDLVGAFRAHAVPLDTLSLDTDWKLVHDASGCVPFDQVAGARPGDPCSWNGWGWNTDIFPDPPAFLGWAHGQGLALAANIHPSIASSDPAFAQAQATSGGLSTDTSTPPCTLYQADPNDQCYIFDWTNADHLQAYFDLHAPLAAQGIDFWWLDWCCDGSSAVATGLTADTWINSLYAAASAARGLRWPAFSRIGASFQEGSGGVGNKGAGAFAEHRYTMHFTGDTCGTWPMLQFEAEMTAAEGNIGLPYVTHDIGSFLGPPTNTGCNGTAGHTAHLPDDMYVRWVQLGVFQPLERLHSHHGDRLPWDYPGAAEAAATQFLRLRERLVPYLYVLARQSYDTGLPMVRSLYLQWPEVDEAYNHRSEYTLGADLLVAPVVAAGNPATVSMWVPPGTWIDYFTGERLTGPRLVDRSVPFERYPVFVREGAILVTQPDVVTSVAGVQDNLTVSAWSGAPGTFELYEDEGQGFGYRDGAFARTPINTAVSAAGCASLEVGAAVGHYPGAPAQRSWTLKLIGIDAPETVLLQGAPAAHWSYDAPGRALAVDTGPRATDESLRLVAGAAVCGT